MRIVILAIGSRGDVQPYVALGTGLRAAGHTVRVATHPLFADLVRQSGLDFALVESDPQAVLDQVRLESGRNPVRVIRKMIQLSVPLVARTLDEFWLASQGADALLAPIAAPGALDIAERLGVPVCLADLKPKRRSRHHPAMFFPRLRLGPVVGPAYNRLTHAISRTIERLLGAPVMAAVSGWRTESLGLPARSTGEFLRARDRIPTLFGISPAAVPRPPDWPPWVYVTGYWFLDQPATWQAPPELEAFLAAGPPPVYIGFGSMRGRDPAVTTAIVVDALGRAGRRGVLLTGWGGLDASAAAAAAAAHRVAVLAVTNVPHDWLFPRMAAVFHHGGAGTTAAGLRSGVPSVALPFFGDQLYWGAMLARLGVGPPPILQQRLTVSRLAEAITRAVTDAEMRARAAAMGEIIRAEDGVGTAVQVLHRLLCARV